MWREQHVNFNDVTYALVSVNRLGCWRCRRWGCCICCLRGTGRISAHASLDGGDGPCSFACISHQSYEFLEDRLVLKFRDLLPVEEKCCNSAACESMG